MSNRALLGAFATLSVALAGTPALGADVFGAKFNHQLTPPEFCDATRKFHICSWILREASGNAGHETAPRDGTIAKIRLVACAPAGSFVLQIVHVDPVTKDAQAVRTGPVINYKGTRRNCTATRNFTIEEFPVEVEVSKGDSLAVIATQVRFMNNSSSGPSALYDPPLAEGDAPRAKDSSSGFLMLQAVLAP